MTLFKQVSFLIVTGFVLLFVLVSTDSLKQSGSVLGAQLQSSAQDTATVLAVSISTTRAHDDPAQLETLLNTVFDSGYYSAMTLLSQDDLILFEKSRDVLPDGVPEWFVNVIDIYPATASANIMEGWVPAGSLKITLHPGFAYKDLYKRLMSTLIWFFSIFIVILSLLWVLLHSLLKPLAAMEKQAQSTEDNRFERLDIASSTKEFKRIISALNRLIGNAQRVYFDQQSTLRELNVLRFQDSLSGLKNRAYMMAELDRIASDDSAFVGCLVLVKLPDIQQLRSRQAYEAADSKIVTFSENITRCFESSSGFLAGRISDDEFLILLEQPWSDIESDVAALTKSGYENSVDEGVKAAACEFGLHEPSNVLLSRLDLALASAAIDPERAYCFVESEAKALPQGKAEWRGWFEQKLRANAFFLVAQPVFDKQERVIHRELFIRANDDVLDDIPASSFMPMANSLDMADQIDVLVLSMLHALPEKFRQTGMAVNLSSSFVSRVGSAGLTQVLESYRASPGTLHFEISHLLWLKHYSECEKLSRAIVAAGQLVAVDHFSLDWSVDFLRNLKPSYIKLGAHLLDDLSRSESASGYRALRNLTLGLGIQLIAVGVDDNELFARLQTLNVDGIQGNLIGEPRKFV